MILEPIFLPAQCFANDKSFMVYRGDLECSVAPGNKQHKLKYHLQQALSEHKAYVATFGGPHSNHIAAFVARCVELRVKPIVVVRGETWASLTPTLKMAVAQGALLFPSLRSDYKLGLQSDVKHTIDRFFDEDVYWVPEGGSGVLGLMGCLDWANQIYDQLEEKSAHVCVASGTGTTAAGFAASQFKTLTVFSALKGVIDLKQQLQEQCASAGLKLSAETECFDESLHGGFGKISQELIGFLYELKELNPHMELDPIYTSKMVYRVNELLKQGAWPYEKTIFIHTGGLQGWQGVESIKCPYDGYHET